MNEYEYKLLKLKLDSKLTNTNYMDIINAIHSTRRDLLGFNGIKPHITINNPITYEVLFDGNNKQTTPIFCFCVPTGCLEYLTHRIQSVLPNTTITVDDTMLNDIDNDFSSCKCYTYGCINKNILSLKTKENNFLESLLSIKKEIKIDHKILFQVQMIPLSKEWKSTNDFYLEELRNGKDVISKNNILLSTWDGFGNLVYSTLSFTDMLFNYDNPNKQSELDMLSKTRNKIQKITDLSTATKQKSTYDGFKTQINLYVAGCDSFQSDTYARTFEVFMRELEEDNRLIMKPLKKNTFYRGFFLGGNILSSAEINGLINLPNQRLQREFKIDSINMKVNDIPKELVNCESGTRIGTDEFHGVTRTIYLPQDKKNRCLSRVDISPMGGGKSNIFLNNIVDDIKSGIGVFIIDHINVGETTMGISDVCKDMNKECVIRNPKIHEFGFFFSELPILETDSIKERLDKANDIAYEVLYLINVIATNADNLSEMMTNYLFAGSKVVFSHYGKTLNDLILVLTDKETRDKYTKLCISEGLMTDKSFEIRKLKELDGDNKSLKALMERFGVLERDSLYQRMLLQPYSDSDNFVKYLDNQTPVSILMTNEDFPSKKKKDVLSTFIMSKIRLAMVRRKNRDKIVDIFIDEPQHLAKTRDVINDSITEPRKYGLSYVFAVQGLSNLGVLKQSLIDTGCHWHLLRGCSKSNFDELDGIISEDFSYQDVMDMEEWHGFNAISINGKHFCFITKYLPQLLNKQGKPYIGD